MRVLIAAFTAVVLMPAVTGSSLAAAPQSRMEQCAAQWQAMKKAGQTGNQTYRGFAAGCIKSSAVPVAPVPAGLPAASGATKLTAARTAPQHNRMKICGAQWQALKKSGKAGGRTYRQFSSQCLKAQ
ncbi:MAG: hypothetical protein ACXU8U_02770 [Asticcacaulis sp.]